MSSTAGERAAPSCAHDLLVRLRVHTAGSVLCGSTAWIRSAEAQQATPWFLFQGMNIVHPPYHTDAEHYGRIPVDDIVIPEWPKLGKDGPVHPCDMQATMKKGCALPADTPTESGLGQDTDAHKRAIRAGYYAMIAEVIHLIQLAGDLSPNKLIACCSSTTTWLGSMWMRWRRRA